MQLRGLSFQWLVVVLLGVFAASPLRGGTVTGTGLTSVLNGTAAPGSSTDYYFFGGAQPNHLTNFTLATPLPSYDAQFNGAPPAVYASLQAPGGSVPFNTGILYATNSTTGVATDMAAFTTTGALTGKSYSIYVLYGNTDLNVVQDVSIGLRIGDGTVTTVNVTDVKNSDDFVRFDITNAAPGETLTIVASSSGGGNRAYIGGVSFTTPVPEPATWLGGVFSVGLGLWGVSRRLAVRPDLRLLS